MKTIIFLILSLLVFQAPVSFAAMKDVVVEESRASGLDTSTPENIVIFGGFAGCHLQAGCGTSSLPAVAGDGSFGDCRVPNGTSTCNSCTGMTTLAGTYQRCAYRSIYGALPLQITMTPDTVSGTAVARADIVVGGTTTAINLINPPNAVQGQPFTVAIPWNEFCLKGLNGNCDNGFSTAPGGVDEFEATLYVGVGDGVLGSGNAAKFTIRFRAVDAVTPNLISPLVCAATDPFCSFKVSPGDEKVYVSDLQRGTPGSGGDAQVKWAAVRVYHAVSECTPGLNGTCGAGQPDFANINLGVGADYEDLRVENKVDVVTNLSSNKVTSNLQNDVSYKFNIATVDETSIVTGFLNPADLNSTDHAATPGQVVGLLDEKKCFIATAAYGSPMESHVQILRKFRNQFLLTNNFGRGFVKTYYTYSPPIAHFIARHETLRTVVRWMLAPVISAAEFMLGESPSPETQERP